MCVGALLESDVEALVFAVPNRADGAAGIGPPARPARRAAGGSQVVVSGIRRDEVEELLPAPR